MKGQNRILAYLGLWAEENREKYDSMYKVPVPELKRSELRELLITVNGSDLALLYNFKKA